MKLTLLVDLDDTLLVNDIETFLPAYLKAFAGWVAPVIEPGLFTQSLLAATDQMVLNHSPRMTLQEAFETAFYPLVKTSPEVFRPLAEQFYAQVYPFLRRVTIPQPEAIQMVEMAQARGYRLVIATNPLFPRAAVHQRLAWAGLPPEQFTFEMVTSYEDFHFSKPKTAYYAELMAQLGWPAGPVVMVGNDLQADITPARCLGLPVFKITPSESPAASPEDSCPSGTLAELLPWLDQADEKSLLPDFNRPEAWLAILLSTPAALNTLSRELAAGSWQRRLKPDEWCLTEIICHWRDVDREVNLPRLQKILQTDNPFLPGMDTDPWAVDRHYDRQDGRQALIDFTATRQEILALLDELPPEAWKRPARHAILGRTTLSEIVSIICSHDRLHIQQAYQTLKTAER